MHRADTDNYRQIFLSDAPLMDLRAPVEFVEGAFPQAVNLPLMSDEERCQVGICYKQNGQAAAIELGHQLVSGEIRQARMERWLAFAAQHSEDGYLYCFRGGLRSRTVQEWLREAGVDYPLIKGGYKAMRRFLIDHLEETARNMPLVILGGLTGCAKTTFVSDHVHGVDLERHANHRGSSFGKMPTPQPTQINFENALAIDLLKQQESGAAWLLLEDEARLIGRCSIPLSLHRAMADSPIVLLHEDFNSRVAQIYQEYVVQMIAAFEAAGVEEPFLAYQDYLLGAIDGVRKRLGSERHLEIRQMMTSALAHQSSTGDLSAHQEWISRLLRDYYDPMYQYQIGKKQSRIIFEGNRQEVTAFLESDAFYERIVGQMTSGG